MLSENAKRSDEYKSQVKSYTAACWSFSFRLQSGFLGHVNIFAAILCINYLAYLTGLRADSCSMECGVYGAQAAFIYEYLILFVPALYE